MHTRSMILTPGQQWQGKRLKILFSPFSIFREKAQHLFTHIKVIPANVTGFGLQFYRGMCLVFCVVPARAGPVSSCEASMVDSVAASCRLSTGAACLSMLTARAPAYSESFSNDGEGKSGCHGPAVPRCHGSSRMRLQTVQGSA